MASLAELVGDFAIVERNVLLVGTADAPLCTSDPTRWALIFALNPNSGQVAYSTSPPGVALAGFTLTGTYPRETFNFRDEAALINVAWFGRAVGANAALQVVEVLYRPTGPTTDLDTIAAELATLRRQSRAIPDHYRRQLSELHRQLSSVPHIAGRK